MRPVQPPQGGCAAAAGGDEAPEAAADAEPVRLHPRREPDDSGGVAAVPGGLTLARPSRAKPRSPENDEGRRRPRRPSRFFGCPESRRALSPVGLLPTL